jgi:hypothetical protein
MAALTRSKLQQLAGIRVEEDKVLFTAGLYDGSIYLCGYVLELALKACICRTLQVNDYPEERLRGAFKTHLPDDLLLLSGLVLEWERQTKASPRFALYWETLSQSSPQQRYESGRTKADAAEALESVTNLEDGVLAWLTEHW